MYQVQVKLQRKEGSKSTSELYLVDAVNLTDIEAKIVKEYKDIFVGISEVKEISFDSIFETGEGTFFDIKIEVEDIDSKIQKERFLQEAKDEVVARKKFKENVDYGEITNFNKTKIMGIIK